MDVLDDSTDEGEGSMAQQTDALDGAKVYTAEDQAELPQSDRFESYTDALQSMYAEVRRLGLESNVAELDVFGLTVVPPEKVGRPDLFDRLQEALRQIAERTLGVPVDLERGLSDEDFASPNLPFRYNDFNSILVNLLYEDRAFEETLAHPVPMALLTYLLGRGCLLYEMTSFVKRPGPDALPLHVDQQGPAPFPFYAQVANVTWVLSDYTMENGPLCYVPGSHRFGYHPKPGDGVDERVPVLTPKGSLIIWGGNLWHGSFPRSAPGLRMNLATFFCRPHQNGRPMHAGRASKEMIERNPPRFRTLMGDQIVALNSLY